MTCALGAIVLIVSPSGCSGKKATLTRERGYPLGASRNAVLDIQVRREGTTLRATNTSARAFGPSLFWINKSHRLPIEAWGVGETITLDLEDFRDEFGDAFRAGGFFASEKPDPVVLAEVEVEGPAGAEVVGLVAIAERK